MLINLALIAGLMFGLWLVSLWWRDASIIDPFWGLGFVILAWSSWLQTETPAVRPLLLVLLTSVWGLRLASYLTWRNWGQEEDRRYRAMRKTHGERFKWISLLTVFGLQALLLWIIALPVQIGIAKNQPNPLHWLDALGVLLWLAGIFFETIGDWQMSHFQANPSNRGKVFDGGLWRYTRHPNYFGDFCIWWGIYLIAFQGGGGWTFFSPLLMSFLLLRVSGVTLLEKDIAERRPEYRKYQQQTNAFFPGPPKET